MEITEGNLCSRYSNVNYGAWHFHILCLVLLFLISLPMDEKKLERSLVS